MASSSLVLGLGLFLVLFGACSGQLRIRNTNDQQMQGQRWRTECRLDRIQAMQPTRKVEAEAGVSEYWDLQGSSEVEDQLQCVGMVAARHTIQQKGLLLPSYTNAPMIFYVVQGRGLHGAVYPGCPETYETGQSGQSRGFQSQSGQEQHQKVHEIQEGDMVTVPAGFTQWLYNSADLPLVLIAFIDVANEANQLDLYARRFHLAGNPRREQKAELETFFRSESLRLKKEGESKTPNGNIFKGFTTNILAESYNIDNELAKKLQSQEDQRERIVRVRGDEFELLRPSKIIQEQEYRQHRGINGFEETICSLKMRHNIDRPSQADIFNPRGGRVTTINQFHLPILAHVRLTAERGVLYKNAMMAPHFNLNSHSMVYCTRGSGRVQIADDYGRSVFNGELHEGQLLVVPQNFAVVKQASSQGFEWIAVKTNENAQRSHLAGRVSVIRAMPDDVLANVFRISREQSRNLKYNRDEVAVFTPSSSQKGGMSWE